MTTSAAPLARYAGMTSPMKGPYPGVSEKKKRNPFHSQLMYAV